MINPCTKRVVCAGLIGIGALCWSRAGAAQQSTGLTLESGSPDAFCPDLTRTRAAVERRLGHFEVLSGPAWRARYTLVHQPEGEPRDFVRLELFDGQGQLKLSRQLPTANESCVTLAEVIALVLDRYFRAVASEEVTPAEPEAPQDAASRTGQRWGRGAEVASPTEPAPRQASTKAELATAQSLLKEAPHEPKPRPPASAPAVHGDRLRSFLLEGGVRTASSSTTLGVRALFDAFHPWLWGVGVRVPLVKRFETLPGSVVPSDPTTGGETHLGFVLARDVAISGSLAFAGHSGPWRYYAGPAVSFGVERASGSFPLPSTLSFPEKYRAIWSLGGVAGVLFEPGGRLLVSGTASLEVPLANVSGRFYVADREVLRLPTLEAWIGCGVGFDWSPR